MQAAKAEAARKRTGGLFVAASSKAPKVGYWGADVALGGCRLVFYATPSAAPFERPASKERQATCPSPSLLHTRVSWSSSPPLSYDRSTLPKFRHACGGLRGGLHALIDWFHVPTLPSVRAVPPVVPQILQYYHVRVVQVACGGRHTVAVSENGEVFSAGSNEFGQLGQGKEEELVEEAGDGGEGKTADSTVGGSGSDSEGATTVSSVRSTFCTHCGCA